MTKRDLNIDSKWMCGQDAYKEAGSNPYDI